MMMAATKATRRLVISGNTRPVKDLLKAKGWRWDGQCWSMMLVEAHAERIVGGDEEFLRGLGGCKKGCQVTMDGIVRWTSKTYGVETATTSQPDQDGFGWNTDAHGNAVAAKRIPGSAPDDMV